MAAADVAGALELSMPLAVTRVLLWNPLNRCMRNACIAVGTRAGKRVTSLPEFTRLPT
jgi:hypothetical protein